MSQHPPPKTHKRARFPSQSANFPVFAAISYLFHAPTGGRILLFSPTVWAGQGGKENGHTQEHRQRNVHPNVATYPLKSAQTSYCNVIPVFSGFFLEIKFRNEKSAQRASFGPDIPADILPKTSVRRSKSQEALKGDILKGDV